VAEIGESLAGRPVELTWGSEGIVSGLPFYLRKARPLMVGPLSPEGRAAVAAHGLLIVCVTGDEGCRQTAESFAQTGAASKSVTLTRSFLGFSSPPASFQITAVPPG